MNACYTKNKINVDLSDSIKSKYILKHIFSYLCIKKKLDIIKYNKKIQNKFQIDIEFYKKISGRYIEIEAKCLNEHKLNI